jgi:hypothetical protein
MAYAVIELLSLNFALNPLFCKTDVTGWRSFVRVVKLLSDVGFAVFCCVDCVSVVLKIFEGKGFKK